MLAVGMTIRAMVRYDNLDPDAGFVAIGEGRFWSMVAQTTKKITL